jgi:hypothetical protein
MMGKAAAYILSSRKRRKGLINLNGGVLVLGLNAAFAGRSGAKLGV